MKKSKTVENNGKITVTKSEERFPYASEILMRHGFGILFLNMALGLLPVTIWGSRMKYFTCSISQLYSVLFCLCFMILSVIYVPVVFFPKADEPKSVANVVILVAMGTAHVIGYIVLMCRGRSVARKMPFIWTQLCKIIQISVIDVYGKYSHLFKELKSYGVWAVAEFIFIVSFTMGSILFFSVQYANGFEDSCAFYNLYLIWGPDSEPTAFQEFQKFTFRGGYFIWQLCSSGHVLVSMLLCYFVLIITICLKSVNLQIHEFKEANGKNNETGINLPKIRFKLNSYWGFGMENTRENELPRLNIELISQKLEMIRRIMLVIEELLVTLSRVWGVSLIVEALVLIASGTSDTFNFLSEFYEKDEKFTKDEMITFTLPHFDSWLSLAVTIFVHFLFLFKLACQVNCMIIEANESMRLLKQATFRHLPQNIQDKIQDLKQDLASATISLTASNYFQINKYLITSITSQIATYVIVLMQFAQQENNGTGEEEGIPGNRN